MCVCVCSKINVGMRMHDLLYFYCTCILYFILYRYNILILYSDRSHAMDIEWSVTSMTFMCDGTKSLPLCSQSQ